jgi:predicted O-methyltransferase YrrM
VAGIADELRQVIERLERDGTAVASSDGSIHSLFPVAITASEGEAVREWASKEGATKTIELGLGYGISALYLCEGLILAGNPAALHVAIDPYQETRFANCGLQALKEAGVADMVEHYREESQIALPRFVSEGRRFDLAFVDGTTASTVSSLILSTSGACCGRAGSCSSTTISCRRSPESRHSS